MKKHTLALLFMIIKKKGTKMFLKVPPIELIVYNIGNISNDSILVVKTNKNLLLKIIVWLNQEINTNYAVLVPNLYQLLWFPNNHLARPSLPYNYSTLPRNKTREVIIQIE